MRSLSPAKNDESERVQGSLHQKRHTQSGLGGRARDACLQVGGGLPPLEQQFTLQAVLYVGGVQLRFAEPAMTGRAEEVAVESHGDVVARHLRTRRQGETVAQRRIPVGEQRLRAFHLLGDAVDKDDSGHRTPLSSAGREGLSLSATTPMSVATQTRPSPSSAIPLIPLPISSSAVHEEESISRTRMSP